MHNWSLLLTNVCREEDYSKVHDMMILNAGKRAEATNLGCCPTDFEVPLDEAVFSVLDLEILIRHQTSHSSKPARWSACLPMELPW